MDLQRVLSSHRSWMVLQQRGQKAPPPPFFSRNYDMAVERRSMCYQKSESTEKKRDGKKREIKRWIAWLFWLCFSLVFSFPTILILRGEEEGRKSRRDKHFVGYTLIRSIASVPFVTNKNVTQRANDLTTYENEWKENKNIVAQARTKERGASES